MGALAGSPDYCESSASFAKGSVDVYVDGVRFAGTAREALVYSTWIDRRAVLFGARFKDAGSLPTKHYVFNGIQYDHHTHRVCLGPKVMAKLQTDQFLRLTFVELEAAVGCLLYCSSVLGLIIPKYHFVLKVCQRRINLLNRDPTKASKIVDLPQNIRALLGRWRNELSQNTPIKPPPHPEIAPRRHQLYTDASSKG